MFVSRTANTVLPSLYLEDRLVGPYECAFTHGADSNVVTDHDLGQLFEAGEDCPGNIAGQALDDDLCPDPLVDAPGLQHVHVRTK